MPFGLVAVDIAGGRGLGGYIFRIQHADIMTCLLAPQANYDFETGGSHLL